MSDKREGDTKEGKLGKEEKRRIEIERRKGKKEMEEGKGRREGKKESEEGKGKGEGRGKGR